MKRKLSRKRSGIGSQNRAPQSAKNKLVAPKSVVEFLAMPEEHQETWKNIVQAVTEVRGGTSLRQAALKFGIASRTASRVGRPALRKLKNGRWAAKIHDSLLRVLPIPTSMGLSEIGVRDSRQASVIGKYWVAVERYRDTEDASALRKFIGKYITDAKGEKVALLTDLGELDRLASFGVLSFESLYARVA